MTARFCIVRYTGKRFLNIEAESFPVAYRLVLASCGRDWQISCAWPIWP